MALPSTAARRLPAIAAACLLSVALPAAPALAKQKTKTPPAEPASISIEHSVSIPSVDAVDSSIPGETLTAILSGEIGDHAEELAGLDATSITVPEITVVVSSTDGTQSYEISTVLSDLVFENVADGVASSVSLGGISMVADDGTFDFDPMSAANVDIGRILAFYGLVPTDETEMATIYTDLRAEGGTFEGEEISCTVGALAGDEFKARPLGFSYAELMVVAEQMGEDPDNVDPAATARFMRMYADIISSFETSEITFDGLNCVGTENEDRQIEFEIAGITMGAMTPGTYPGVTVEGFDMTIDEDGESGTMSVDSLTFKPADLSGLIATFESAPDTVDDAWFEANARGLIPAMEGFAFSGFSMDIPDVDAEGARIAADIGAFDLTLGNYRNAIPTVLDMSASNIRATIPETGDPTMDQFRALGLSELDAGFRIAASWNEETSTIDIEEISMNDPSLATVMIDGTIANATANLFAVDVNTALAASMGLAVNALNGSVTDTGLTDLVISLVAAEQGTDPATLRPIFAGIAEGTVIGALAGAADAAKLGSAVNAFVSGTARTLEIGIEAKQAPGLNLMDFMAAETDPTILLDKVNISAEAK